jgi:aminocarboxymuconate-semialdehyde decarboxylase
MVSETSPGNRTGGPVVDVHAHVVPPAVLRAFRQGGSWHGLEVRIDASCLVWQGNGKRDDFPTDVAEITLQQRLQAMDRNLVDVQLLSHMPKMFWYSASPNEAPNLASEVNDSIAQMVASAPSRFCGLAHLPLQNPAASLSEMDRAIGDLGMVGFEVGSHVNGIRWDSPQLFPILQRAEELDSMVLIHPCDPQSPLPGHPFFLENLVGLPFETTLTAASMILAGVFDRLTRLRVCLAHGGGYIGFALGRLDHGYQVNPRVGAASKRPASEYVSRLWLDSAVHSHRALRFVLDSAGAERIVLGTDYPAAMGQDHPVEWVRSAEALTVAEKAAILGGNIPTLLGRQAAALRQS